MSDFQAASEQFLTPEECAEVDTAMMTSRDRFSARVAIYSLRSLKQIAQRYGQPIAGLLPPLSVTPPSRLPTPLLTPDSRPLPPPPSLLSLPTPDSSLLSLLTPHPNR